MTGSQQNFTHTFGILGTYLFGFDDSLNMGLLSPNQRRGTITLLLKKCRDNMYIKNSRPIDKNIIYAPLRFYVSHTLKPNGYSSR